MNATVVNILIQLPVIAKHFPNVGQEFHFVCNNFFGFIIHLIWGTLIRFVLNNLKCCLLYTGKALSLALGERGIFVTVLDLSEEKGKHVASLIDKQNAKFHQNLKFPSSMFIRCDVCDRGNKLLFM